MKLLVVIPTFYPKLEKGGPIISLYNQLSDLSKKIYIEVATFQNLTTKDISIQKSNLNINYKIFNINKYQLLKFFFDIKKFDVIFVNSIFSFHCLKFIFLSIIHKKNLIISPRGSVSQSALKHKFIKKKFILFLVRALLNKKNTVFLLTSNFEKDALSSYFPNYNFKVLPNGLNSLNLKYGQTNLKQEILNFIDDKTILYFSRIDRKKNLHKLIEVIGEFKLLIVGAYDDQKYFNELKLNNPRIKYVGPIYNSNSIKIIFRKVSFLCLPSNFENFANCILDSIYYDCPVLISNNVGLKDQISKFGLGLVYSDEIKNDHLKSMYRNLNHYKKQIQNNKLEFLKIFTWSNINDEFIRLFNNRDY